MTDARAVVLSALAALAGRNWDALAAVLDPDVVHRTPGVPTPILGREAFLHLARDAVRKTPDISFTAARVIADGSTVVVEGEWRYTDAGQPVRQPSCSVIEVRDGRIVRDEEYLGLAY
ncbi:MAG TPA: nuclear transport factor 2 family protein [Candidatus Limnocylindrales bacterium]|nr:nuclear transport factor 2 family protein [Candidatus Limnocylindrales bacterium]